MNVVVLGASDDPQKYSHMAVRLLEEKGHQVFPVNPRLKTLNGRPVYGALSELGETVDTISVYVSSKLSSGLAEDILAARPRRVIFNPGAENPPLQSRLSEAGIQVLQACTLVLLKTGQF